MMYSYGKRITSNTTSLDHQVCLNIAAETALTKPDRKALLMQFAVGLAEGHDPVEAWKGACRSHKFKGRQLPADVCPEVLGRVTSLRGLAGAIARKFRDEFTPDEARQLLLRWDGLNEPGSTVAVSQFETIRNTPLGNFLIWATFDPIARGSDPFARLPPTRDAIRTALGLGHFEEIELLVTLVWDHVASGSPPLHRPTIADAEDSNLLSPPYQPKCTLGRDPSTNPNGHGVGPQPEVVLGMITGRGLKFPIRIL